MQIYDPQFALNTGTPSSASLTFGIGFDVEYSASDLLQQAVQSISNFTAKIDVKIASLVGCTTNCSYLQSALRALALNTQIDVAASFDAQAGLSVTLNNGAVCGAHLRPAR